MFANQPIQALPMLQYHSYSVCINAGYIQSIVTAQMGGKVN